MKIASFNINGVKARIGALTGWLAGADADVVVLQEIKSVDEGFPRDHFEDLGWNVETHGQKGFNGVAILSNCRWRMCAADCRAARATNRRAISKRR